MDIVSFIGVVLALIAVVGGSILKGAGVKALLSSAAFTIVVLGTAAAIMIHTPGVVLKKGLSMAKWVFKPPVIEPEPLVEKIVEWSKIARKDGLLGLEEVSEKEEMEFLKKGLQLLIDGNEPEEVRQILEIDMDAYENFHTLGAKVYEGLGIYAPTLGIIGAVMGLMAVMQNLADPSKLGTGIAAAFVATIYGIGFANLVFLPMASKLKYIIGEQVKLYQLIVDGLVMIAEGENPRNIEMKLSSYFI